MNNLFEDLERLRSESSLMDKAYGKSDSSLLNWFISLETRIK